MTRVMLDDQTLEKLLNLTEPLEICDKSGRVLATCTPLDERERALRSMPQLSDEELERRAQEPGYTIDEVIARLESLGQ